MSDPRTPKLADVITVAVDSALADFHVCLPGKVQSYDGGKQAADVQPILKQTYVDENGDEQVVAFPVIRNVPVVFPGGGGFRITFPVQAGDDVLLVFSDLGLDKYLSNGGDSVDPVGLQQHHLADAIAIPGLHPFNAPWSGGSSANMTVGKDGGPQVHFKANAIALGDASAVEPVLYGNAWKTAFDTYVVALQAWVTAVTTPTPGGGTVITSAGTTLAIAKSTFDAAYAAALSPTVKVK